jgi:hemolysin activation/secretion protein
VAYEHWNTLEGQGSDPSIETVYTPATAPGLGADPTYLHTKFSAGIDWRQSPGYTRKGGLYQATFHDYRNNNGGIYSFQRLDGEVIQHFPILRETWVLAVRGRVETTLNDSNLVPYFLLPELGSGSTLRGYATDRFRDLNSILFSAEFRWIPTTFLDMALFYDAGKVTSQRGDLNFSGLKSDVGIGVRFHQQDAGLARRAEHRPGRRQRRPGLVERLTLS